LFAEPPPNCSTRTSGWARWTAAVAASVASTRSSTCSSVPAISKSTVALRPSRESWPSLPGLERRGDVLDVAHPLQARDHVAHRRGERRIARADRAAPLDQDLLVDLVGKARVRDRAVGHLRGAVARRPRDRASHPRPSRPGRWPAGRRRASRRSPSCDGWRSSGPSGPQDRAAERASSCAEPFRPRPGGPKPARTTPGGGVAPECGVGPARPAQAARR
jgi:hypothetical protein